ncbi:MAG: glycosyltransferase family 2 protein [Chitinophagales bacterium]|nr:glycosyltransferase family 2 protein [Chitinophagales bacterium]
MKFSIIIPTYNRAHLIGKAIQSVQQQTYTDWELLIVDDGSTDNTKEAVLSFLKDQRIHYIYQQNAERSAARNNGIKNATGNYICFLDSDDYYLPQRLELLHQSISHHADSRFFYTGICFEKNGLVSKSPIEAYSGGNVFDFLVGNVIGIPQVCMHRSLFQRELFNPAISNGEDVELWLRIANYELPKYLEDQFTIVALDHNDRSVSIKNNGAAHSLKTLLYIFAPDKFGGKISPGIQQARISGCYVQIAYHHIFFKRRLKAIQYLLKAIFADSSSVQTKFRVNILAQLCLYFSWQRIFQLTEISAD